MDSGLTSCQHSLRLPENPKHMRPALFMVAMVASGFLLMVGTMARGSVMPATQGKSPLMVSVC